MGLFFQTKAKSKESSVYSKMITCNSPQYTTVNYKGIALEGYKSNFIINRCMQEIIKGCIQLKWKVKKYNSNGEVEEINNHPAIGIIEKPNKLYGQSELIKRAIAFYYIGGEAPFHKIMTNNKVKELYVYRPDKIKFEITGNVENPYTNIYYKSNTEIPIEADKFMIWKNFNPLDEFDGLGRGMGTLEPVLRNGDLLNEMLNWNISLLQNGGNLSGVINLIDGISDSEFDRAKKEVKNQYQGTDNVGKYMLLSGASSFTAIGTNPKDMDWIQGKESVIQDICYGLGVDPIIIGLNKSASYNNKNEAEKGLYTKVVIPLMRELADQLGPFLELQEGEYLDIDYSHIPVLQTDMKELADALSKAKDMTINEKRQKRGLEPINGGDIIAPEGSFALIDGKVYIPMNLVSLEEDTSTQREQEQQKAFLY